MPAWTILRRDPSRKSSADLSVANKTTSASSTDQREQAKRLGMPRLSFVKSLFSRTKPQEKGRGDGHNDADVGDKRGTYGSVALAVKTVSCLLLSIVDQYRGARVECRHGKSVGVRKRRMNSSSCCCCCYCCSASSASPSRVGEYAPRRLCVGQRR